jgi:CRISPR-associated protein Csd1
MGDGCMILESLCDLARREHLLADPDYEPKPVAGFFAIDDGGKFVGFVSTMSSEGGKKARGKTMQIPRRAGRTSAAAADFLVDKSEYVLGIQPEGVATSRKPEELAVRRGLFRDSVQCAFDATGAPALRALNDFLGNEEERGLAATQLSASGYSGNDLFAFEYRGQLIHDVPEIRKYFSESRRSSSECGVQCLICGSLAVPVEKHPTVRIPGGTTSGIAMVSFNSDAFESFGLERNENAPVCRNCADAYTTALNRLLSDRYPDPKNPAIPLGKQFVRLSPDTTAVFWSSEPSEVVNLFADYFEAPTEEAVRELFEAPHKGRMPLSPSNRFYCLILTGAQGRAILRGMHTGTVAQVEESVRAWFSSIDIGSPQPLPLWRLMSSIVLQGKRENLPPGLTADVFAAIILGRQFPQTLLARAIARCIAERTVTRERAALVRGYLTRNRPERKIEVGLDKENADAGYRLGRLLAVLERVQSEAQNNPNKTIVDRYYGSASTRPAVVFPKLISLAQHHLAKLEGHRDVFFQKLLGEVADGIAAPMPSTLRLEEQGQFALGYYQQRQEFFKKREVKDNDQSDGRNEQGDVE